jgi:hypothetical protein
METPTLLIGVAAIISALAQVIEARWGSGKDLRDVVEHLVYRADRLDSHLGLPPLPRKGKE